MVTVKLSEVQWNTVYTALRLERERNWGKDPDVLAELESAIIAVKNWKEAKDND